METEVTLEYGKNLKGSRTIHKEMLSCHSQYARKLFKDAETLTKQYSLADDLRRQLKDFVFPHVSEKTFDEEHMERKVCNLLLQWSLIEHENSSSRLPRKLTLSPGDSSDRSNLHKLSAQSPSQ
jgi:hypothetical protein